MAGRGEAARALRDAVRRLIVAHAALDEDRRPCGAAVPLPHAWALLELKARAPMTIRELSAGLNVDRSNVSRLCARMESLGEIERALHPSDRRACVLRLTERGQRAADAIDQSSAGHFAEVLERLGDPEQVIASLQALAFALCPKTPENP